MKEMTVTELIYWLSMGASRNDLAPSSTRDLIKNIIDGLIDAEQIKEKYE